MTSDARALCSAKRERIFSKPTCPSPTSFEELRNRIEIFLRGLKEFFPEAAQSFLHFSRIQDEDWGLTWRRHFQVERVTQRLTIVPAWEPVPQAPGGMVIQMDPGPAFGTGAHPTTRMCLESIEKSHIPGAWTMLDVGTGSGILAIYAAKLGARRVLAIDTDPEALRWAQRNIDLNHASRFIELTSKSVAELNDVFSILVANLTRDALVELLPDFQRLLEKDGTMILSGLLQEQVQDVKKPLALLGYQRVSRLSPRPSGRASQHERRNNGRLEYGVLECWSNGKSRGQSQRSEVRGFNSFWHFQHFGISYF